LKVGALAKVRVWKQGVRLAPRRSQSLSFWQTSLHRIAGSPGQHAEWLNAIKNGTPTASPFSYAGPLSEANHLGNVAFRAASKIVWDAKAMKITNNEAANRFLSREPRKGWGL